MSTELSEDEDAIIARFVSEGRFPDRRRALDHAVELLREEAETLDDLREGLASAQRGEGIALKSAFDRMRKKYDIPEGA